MRVSLISFFLSCVGITSDAQSFHLFQRARREVNLLLRILRVAHFARCAFAFSRSGFINTHQLFGVYIECSKAFSKTPLKI